MATTSWKSPTTYTIAESTGSTWTAAADYGYSYVDKNGDTDRGRWHGFGFSTSDIPDGSTINGIEVQFNAYYSSGSTRDFDLVINIYDDTNGQSSTKSQNNLPNGSSGTYNKGGVSDLWGNGSVLDSKVRDTDFGVEFEGFQTGGASTILYVDNIEIRIHYTEPPSNTKVWNGSSWIDAVVKARVSGSWVEKPLKYRSGGTWNE